ncbi:MAG: DUF3592 domain-containing protein [Flavobacteriaceae bacterium]
MEFFAELSKTQLAGLILLLVAIPLFIFAIKILLMSKDSVQWTKVNGEISEVPDYGAEVKFSLKYTYSVDNTKYSNSRIIFSSSTIYRRYYAKEFERKYRLHQMVDVYYNPEKPSQAVLEPGRTDAIPNIVLLSVFMLLGGLALFNESLILQLLDTFSRFFN